MSLAISWARRLSKARTRRPANPRDCGSFCMGAIITLFALDMALFALAGSVSHLKRIPTTGPILLGDDTKTVPEVYELTRFGLDPEIARFGVCVDGET